MHALIIFASGKGTNAAALINYFKNGSLARVTLIITNNPQAGVIPLAIKENIPYRIVSRTDFHSDHFVHDLVKEKPTYILLAGFLWKIPEGMIRAFPRQILNIHPALLPEHGGKGMYGDRVHQSVLASGKNESGISIHFVDEVYDRGEIILQARCPIAPGDQVSDLAERIHRLEHFFFPRTIEFLLTGPETTSQYTSS